jgi:hypothetical protein
MQVIELNMYRESFMIVYTICKSCHICCHLAAPMGVKRMYECQCGSNSVSEQKQEMGLTKDEASYLMESRYGQTN